MTDLDTRMRAAGDSLVRASERLSPAVPPRSLRPLAAVASAATVAVALVVLAVVVRDDGETSVATSGPPPRLVPDVVPRGLEALGATELPARDDARLGGLSVTVYGDPGADDPFAIDLGVMVFGRGDAFPEADEDSELVGVRGHTGWSDHDTLGTALSWEEAPGFHIMLASRALERDQLVEIAEELVVDTGERTVDLGRLPNDVDGPLVPLGATADLSAGSGWSLPADVRGHALSYQGGDDPLAEADNRLDIGLFTGDAGDLAVIRWSAGAHTPIQVRGHQGWASPDDAADETPATVVWEESPGVLAVVQSWGVSADDVRASVESLRPATDDEWDGLLRLGASDDFTPPDQEGAVPVGPGEGADDTAVGNGDSLVADVPGDAVGGLEGVYADGSWAVYLQADGTICGSVDDGDNPASTCDPTGAAVTTAVDGTGHPILLFGVMPDGAVGRLTTGGNIELSQTHDAVDGASIYVMVIVDGQAPTEITFVDADGHEVATAPVDL